MTLALAIGYPAKSRTADPTVLYCGTDGSAAQEAANHPPAGIVRTEYIKNPLVNFRRFHEVPEVPAADPAPAEAKPPARKPARKAAKGGTQAVGGDLSLEADSGS